MKRHVASIIETSSSLSTEVFHIALLFPSQLAYELQHQWIDKDLSELQESVVIS